MELLTMINNEVSINPHALSIKEFATIWNSDKSKDKSEAKKKFSCILFFCKPNSIYNKYDPKEREEAIAVDVLDKKEFTKDIIKAIEKYSTFRSITEEYLESQINALRKGKDYYNNIDYSQRDEKGNLLYKIKEVQSSIKDTKGVLATIKDLQEQLKQEQGSDGNIRGGAEKGMFEEGYGD